MSLREDVKKLTEEKPEMRKHLVPLLKQSSFGTVEVTQPWGKGNGVQIGFSTGISSTNTATVQNITTMSTRFVQRITTAFKAAGLTLGRGLDSLPVEKDVFVKFQKGGVFLTNSVNVENWDWDPGKEEIIRRKF